MCCLRFTMSSSYRKAVEHQLQTVQHLGNLRQGKYLLALLAVMDGRSCAQVAGVLRVGLDHRAGHFRPLRIIA